MENQSLKGKVAAVTGASSGIGQVIAETLGRAGAHVFMCGRTTEVMEVSATLIEDAGGGATLKAFDVRDSAAVQSFVEGAARYQGRLDILVNNAGLGHQTSIADGDPEHWREMLEVNVLALLVGCQAAIKAMRATGSKGRIINISSNAARNRASGVYGATKHAVNCINASLSDELQDDDIRVTSIMPGVFASNFIRNFDADTIKHIVAGVGEDGVASGSDGKFSREFIDELQKKNSQEVGDPQQIANAVLYIVNQPIDVNLEELVIRPQKVMS